MTKGFTVLELDQNLLESRIKNQKFLYEIANNFNEILVLHIAILANFFRTKALLNFTDPLIQNSYLFLKISMNLR